MPVKSEASLLEDLPNIGKEMSLRLQKAGISTPEELERTGSIAAWKMTRRTQSCWNSLYALEGALRGIRWHELTPEDREELRKAALAR